MNNRSNICCYSLGVYGGQIRKDVYVYEDHRTLLNVLYHARKNRLLRTTPTLVTFDYHSDFHDSIAAPAKLAAFRKRRPTDPAFWSFVEFDIDPLDGDWMKTGMELGLIGDVILVGCQQTDQLKGLKTSYTDHTGVVHDVYSMMHLWEGPSSRSWLLDGSRVTELKPVWDLLGWASKNGSYGFAADLSDGAPLVLDFDLDCFSVPAPGGHIPWTKERFAELFTRRINEKNATCVKDDRPGAILQELSSRAEFITIARESPYCGGFRGSDAILECLDGLLFSDRLRSACQASS